MNANQTKGAAQPTDAGLYIQNFHLASAEKCFIDQLNCKVTADRVFCLMGPSGIGKSSLLLYILGVLPDGLQATGNIFLNNLPINLVAPHKRNIGIVFQNPLLFPNMNVLQNLIFAIPKQVKRKEKPKIALAALDTIGLADIGQYTVDKLSGGQKARVALVRTILAQPKAILLDEPFANLDQQVKESVQERFLSYIQKFRVPTLLVTHDQQDAIRLNAEIYELSY